MGEKRKARTQDVFLAILCVAKWNHLSQNAAEVHSLTPIRSGRCCVALRLACLTHSLDRSACDPGQDSQRLPELESKSRSVAKRTVKNPIPDQHSCSEMLWDDFIKLATQACEQSAGLACAQMLAQVRDSLSSESGDRLNTLVAATRRGTLCTFITMYVTLLQICERAPSKCINRQINKQASE